MNSALFKISFRNLLKHKGISITNILGFTIGFTAFILIALFIRYEVSWDKFNKNYDRLYRVQLHYSKAMFVMGGNDISPHTSPITAQLLEEKFPEFEKISAIKENEGKYLSMDNEHLVYEKDGIYADENLFQLFTFQLLEGNMYNALAEPFSIVLSKSTANKLFANKPALGRIIYFEKKYQFKVTGVYADLPHNSSLRPNYIISFKTIVTTEHVSKSDAWSCICKTYALVKPNTDIKLLNNKISDVLSGFRGMEYEKLQLCPMSKVYLNFNNRDEYLIILKLFGLIAALILIMSVFNYVNLSIAKLSLRTKEVAIKKVLGSNRKTLVFQFLTETIIMSFIALILSLIVAKAFLPAFSAITDKQIHFQVFENLKFTSFLLIIMLLVGILSGAYPAFFMSSKQITALQKGSILGKTRESFNLKKVLVTFQFVISLFLILLTLSISRQIKYLTQKDLGFEKNNILYTQINVSQNGASFEQVRNRCLQHTGIKNACFSENLPFVRFGGGKTNWEGGNQDEKVSCRFNNVSYDYLNTIEATLIAGRDFSRDFPGDEGNGCIINESAAKCFGWKNPIGKHLSDNRLTVVGVVRNFVYKDIHNVIEPNILVLTPDNSRGDWIFSFRIDGTQIGQVKAFLTEEFEKYFPNDPFEFHDLTTTFNNEDTFKTYHSINYTILFFSVINILLAVIGLMSLVSFTVTQRNKEIGIRKINGSSSWQIFYLLSHEYYLLFFIAIIVSVPMAWWTYSFIPGAFKLPAQPLIFVFGILVLFVIILFTMSHQTLKAARRNPVEALRYE